MKKIIVLSSPDMVVDEVGIINGLFDAGLMVFHLRKPNYSPEALHELLNGIKQEYHDRIALPAVLLDTPLFERTESKMVHFFEHLRHLTLPDVFKKLQEQGLTLSTSIHEATTYGLLHEAFDYTFFSPVFDSISKNGYKAMDKKELSVLKQKRETKVIALGGIDEHNCLQALDEGFDGIALLGCIWENNDPVAVFKRIHAKVSAYESL
jgi:thiamine-phosphate pyrophosphorylase